MSAYQQKRSRLEEDLRHAVLKWYIFPLSDRKVEAELHRAMIMYALMIYGDLTDEDIAIERKYMRSRG